MNKLCSRNTALATAAGPGTKWLRAGSLSASRGFLSLQYPRSLSYALFIFLLFFSYSFFFLSSLHLYVLSMFNVSLSRSRRRIGVSHSSALSLSLRLISFHPELRYCKLPTCLLHRLARSLFLRRFSQ